MGLLKKIKISYCSLLIISCNCFALDSVKLQLRWFHQFQFAGYYMAIENGYYQDAGIELNLIEGGYASNNPVDEVLNHKVEFAISGSGVVLEKMAGKSVVALAAISQTSPLVWITLKKNKLNLPQDLIGKTLSMINPVESAELLALFKKEGIDYQTAINLHAQMKLADLISGKIDAFNGYFSNEPFLLKQQNIEYSLIAPKDYGVNFYNDVLITSQTLAQDSPTLVENFTKASLKGWQYAFDHIEETAKVIQQKYASNKTIEHLIFEGEALKTLAMPQFITIGHMNPGRWQSIAATYQELKMANGNEPIDDLIYTPYKPDFGWLVHLVMLTSIIIIVLTLIAWRFAYLTGFLKKEINRRKYAESCLVKANEKLKIQATSDPLTQIYNRRAFFDEGKALINLAQRKSMNVTLFMLDLDHFKQINDKYSHKVGDKVLQAMSSSIKNNLIRDHDIFARIGGEEFAILMLDCDLTSATKVAERVLECVRNIELKTEANDTVKLTASIGIALVKQSIDDCLSNADTALYQAKSLGRNRFVIHEEVS